MSLEHLTGRGYGPFVYHTARQKVAEFVDATSDEPEWWTRWAPPGFAAALLFAAAPAFFADEEIAPEARMLVHGEQRFRWHDPIPLDADLSVSGAIERVRTRDGVHFVTFGVTATDGDRPVVESTSLFLMSGASPPAGSTIPVPLPAPSRKAADERPTRLPLPAAGSSLPELRKSASRADVIRYAGATRDFNPVHWDDGAARAAGLPGVVCHGLLLAAWMIQAAVRCSPEPERPLDVRLRFRAPVHPGEQAVLSADVRESSQGVARLALALEVDGGERVSGEARVRHG